MSHQGKQNSRYYTRNNLSIDPNGLEIDLLLSPDHPGAAVGGGGTIVPPSHNLASGHRSYQPYAIDLDAPPLPLLEAPPPPAGPPPYTGRVGWLRHNYLQHGPNPADRVVYNAIVRGDVFATQIIRDSR